jgi:hypothetical protein
MQMLQNVWQAQGWVVAINTPEAMDRAAPVLAASLPFA